MFNANVALNCLPNGYVIKTVDVKTRTKIMKNRIEMPATLTKHDNYIYEKKMFL